MLVLDVSDLVMMDPIGTGYAIPAGEGTGEDFWGVDPDINASSQFIARFITQHDRWNSPKFVLGESYGGIRTGGVAYRLLDKYGMGLNGVILVSPFMDAAAARDRFAMDLTSQIARDMVRGESAFASALKRWKGREERLIRDLVAHEQIAG